jgi:hypothetical protein
LFSFELQFRSRFSQLMRKGHKFIFSSDIGQEECRILKSEKFGQDKKKTTAQRGTF